MANLITRCYVFCVCVLLPRLALGARFGSDLSIASKGGADTVTTTAEAAAAAGIGQPWGFIPWLAFAIWLAQHAAEQATSATADPHHTEGVGKKIGRGISRGSNIFLLLGGLGLAALAAISDTVAGCIGPAKWWLLEVACDIGLQVLLGMVLKNTTGLTRWLPIAVVWIGLLIAWYAMT